MRRFAIAASAALVLLVAVARLPAQEAKGTDLVPEITTDKPKPSVLLAKSWDAAVEEAKLLNVPLVIHNHGFY